MFFNRFVIRCSIVVAIADSCLQAWYGYNRIVALSSGFSDEFPLDLLHGR